MKNTLLKSLLLSAAMVGNAFASDSPYEEAGRFLAPYLQKCSKAAATAFDITEKVARGADSTVVGAGLLVSEAAKCTGYVVNTTYYAAKYAVGALNTIVSYTGSNIAHTIKNEILPDSEYVNYIVNTVDGAYTTTGEVASYADGGLRNAGKYATVAAQVARDAAEKTYNATKTAIEYSWWGLRSVAPFAGKSFEIAAVGTVAATSSAVKVVKKFPGILFPILTWAAYRLQIEKDNKPENKRKRQFEAIKRTLNARYDDPRDYFRNTGVIL